MKETEKKTLKNIIKSMSSENGDCLSAWKNLCSLAEMPTFPPPPFDEKLLSKQREARQSENLSNSH